MPTDANLGKLTVFLEANMRQFATTIDQAAITVKNFSVRSQAHLNRLGTAIHNFVSRAAARMSHFASRMTRYFKYAAAAATIAIIKLGADAEEAENLFVVAFENMSDSVRQWSQTLAERLKVSATGIRENAAQFKLFLDGIGLAAEGAKEMSLQLTELVYDMSSLRNLKFDDTMRKIQAALAGEVEPLRRIGITVNETTAGLWAHKHGLDANTESWSEQQKVIARTGVIFEGAVKDMGDMERTSGSVTNVIRSLVDQIKELAISIYQYWQPALAGALTSIRDYLVANRENIARTIGNIGDKLARWAKWLMTDFNAAIKAALDIVLETFKAFGKSIAIIIEDTFSGIARNIGPWIRNALADRRRYDELYEQALESVGGNMTPGEMWSQYNPERQGRGLPVAISQWWKEHGEAIMRERQAQAKKMAEDAMQFVRSESAEFGAGTTPMFQGTGTRLKQVYSELSAEISKITAELPDFNNKQDEALGGAVDNAAKLDAQMNKLIEEFQKAGKAAEENLGKPVTEKLSKEWQRVANTMSRSMANAFEDMLFEARTWKEALTAILRDVAREIARQFAFQPFANMITGWASTMMGGVPAKTAHSGWAVGSGFAERRVPALAFAGAPRLHQGLASDEFPAILQRGETVLPAGQPTDIRIELVNQTSTKMQMTEGPPRLDITGPVRQVILQDIAGGNGPISRAIDRRIAGSGI